VNWTQDNFKHRYYMHLKN